MISDREEDGIHDMIPVIQGHGSHGDHWKSIHPDEDWVMELIEETIKTMKVDAMDWSGFNLETQKDQDNRTQCYIKENPAISSMVLAVNESVWTAYPYPRSGIVHPVLISRIVQWPNIIEGQYEVYVYGTSLRVFDPLFYKNHGRVPKVCLMKFGALAYEGRKAKERRYEAYDGKNLSSRGVPIFIPFRNGSRDDYTFHIPVKKVEEVDIFGIPGYRFTGPLFNSERPFNIPIYVTELNMEGTIPEVGDDLEGTLWLQGTINGF